MKHLPRAIIILAIIFGAAAVLIVAIHSDDVKKQAEAAMWQTCVTSGGKPSYGWFGKMYCER